MQDIEREIEKLKVQDRAARLLTDAEYRRRVNKRARLLCDGLRLASYKSDSRVFFKSDREERERLAAAIKQNSANYVQFLKQEVQAKDDTALIRERNVAMIKKNGRQNMLTFIKAEPSVSNRLPEKPTIEFQNIDKYHRQESLNQQLHYEIPTNLENYIDMKQKLAQKAAKLSSLREDLPQRTLPKRAKKTDKAKDKPRYYNEWFIPVRFWSKRRMPTQDLEVEQLREDEHFVFRELYRPKEKNIFNENDEYNEKILRARNELCVNKEKMKVHAPLLKQLKQNLLQRGSKSATLEIRLGQMVQQ